MDSNLHRLLMDTYFKLTQVLFWKCISCGETVQQYLMNGTPINQCSRCLTKKPEISLNEDRNKGE